MIIYIVSRSLYIYKNSKATVYFFFLLYCIGRCVQNRRLCWFGHIERMDKSLWVSRCRVVEVSGSAGRGRPKKTWEEVIKMDLRERRVNQDLARDRLAWKSIF